MTWENVRRVQRIEMLPSLASYRVPGTRRDAPSKSSLSRHPTWAPALSRLVDEGVSPALASAALKRWARQWDMARRASWVGENAVEIRTVHRAKALTCKVTVGVRTDLIGLERREAFSREGDAREGHGGSGLALAYVLASRAETVHVELALRRPNRFHGARGLDGWEYVGWPDGVG